MTDRGKWALFLVCAFVVAIAGLTGVGVAIGSEWSTFIPDLIIGVIGASVIGLALFALQESSERRRVEASDVSNAYARLLDALTPLRTLDLLRGDAALLSVAGTRMVQLYEAIVPDDHALARWLEAERQLSLYRALQAHEALAALTDKSADAALDASAPFHGWVSEFSGNVRFWRSGRMTAQEMNDQSGAIERMLEAVGAWRAAHYPWRDDVGRESGGPVS